MIELGSEIYAKSDDGQYKKGIIVASRVKELDKNKVQYEYNVQFTKCECDCTTTFFAWMSKDEIDDLDHVKNLNVA